MRMATGAIVSDKDVTRLNKYKKSLVRALLKHGQAMSKSAEPRKLER